MAIRVREYENYEKYIEHQKEKTGDASRRQRLFMTFDNRKQYFLDRFKSIMHREWPSELDFKMPEKNSKIVCLGARMGPEVAAWRELGYEDSIGTDLIPRPPYVVVEPIDVLSLLPEALEALSSCAIPFSMSENTTEIIMRKR